MTSSVEVTNKRNQKQYPIPPLGGGVNTATEDDLSGSCFLTLRLFCLLTFPFEVCEQIHLLMLVTR